MRVRWVAGLGRTRRRRRTPRWQRALQRKATVSLLAFTLPLALGTTTSGGQHLSLPTGPGVRSAVDRLLAWVSDDHSPVPQAPRQESGTATGRSHEVPASATRSVGHATGRAPGKGRGQMPAYAVHVPKPRQDTTGWIDPGNANSFSPRTSTLIASSATATSDLYRNLDGSYTRLEYPSPVNYQAASGAWVPIDTDLVAEPSGRWQAKAVPLATSFAPNANSRVLAEVSGGDGAGSFGLGIGVSGGSKTLGAAAGSVVSYPGVLADTDLAQQATATGVTESFTLDGAGAPGGWTFSLALTGLKPVAEADGAIDFLSAAGTPDLVIPAVVGLEYQLATGHGGTELAVTVSPQWLAEPGRAFPVTTGFSVLTPAGASAAAAATAAASAGAGAGTAARELDFTGPAGAGVRGTHLTSASLHVLEQCPVGSAGSGAAGASGASAGEDIGVSVVGGPPVGNLAGTPACDAGESSAWMSVPVSTSGLTVLGSQSASAGERLTVTTEPGGAASTPAAASGAGGAVASPAAAVSPAPASAGLAAATATAVLVVTAATTTDTPPQINSQYPPNNYNEPTLTPELMATGQDNNGTTDSPEFEFQVYSSAGTKLADSGFLAAAGTITPSGQTPVVASGDWVVPSGDLAWGQTYYWVVQDYDGTDYSGTPSPSYFSTPVPQPLITSGLSQNSGPGYSASSGNYTTSATDASVSVVGPALSIERDYNSLDPRTSGAFGAGWSSELDMKVSLGQASGSGSTATEEVTYPDGSQVAFGLNANGTYTSAEGRYATLATVSSGGFTLTDKNDTVYTFTQALAATGPWGASAWGITSITDALGHVLKFTNSSSDEVTAMTSEPSTATGSQRSLTLTWNPGVSGVTSPHVATVVTTPVSGSGTAITWTYTYSGDQLQTACLTSDSNNPCTKYTYQAGSDYPEAVLDSGPHSYWRLDEASGATSAADSVLFNEGADNATYSNVTLGQDTGPLAGGGAKAATFNGTTSEVTLPHSLVSGATYESVSVWFKTTATSEVLFSYQLDQLSAGTTSAHYTPSLYIGSDGYLHGEFWTNTVQPMVSSTAVNDGSWHLATLTASGTTQSLYLDGKQVGTPISNKAIEVTPQLYDYVGAGFLGGSWPDEADEGKNGTEGYASYFKGDLSDFGFWSRPLTATEIAAMYAAGHGQANLMTKVTRPSGNTYEAVTYNAVDSTVNQVTDSNGDPWTVNAPSVTGTSQGYVGAVLGAQPVDYWRLGDTATTDAINQVNGGTAAYNDVGQGVGGGRFADTTMDRFDGSTAYLTLPDNLSGPGAQGVSMWFKTGSASGVLLSSSASQVAPSATTPGNYTPILYVGSNGYLYGKFWDGTTAVVLRSAAAVDDSQWHNVVLTAGGGSQDMMIDGAFASSESSNPTGGEPDGQTNMYLEARLRRRELAGRGALVVNVHHRIRLLLRGLHRRRLLL